MLYDVVQGRRDLNTTVYCFGDGQCSININPSTTAGEVRCGITYDLHRHMF